MVFFKKILLIILLVTSLAKSYSQLYNYNVINKNDTIKYVNHDLNFSGNLKEFYPGDLKFEGNYKNGLKNGQFIYYKKPETRRYLNGFGDLNLNFIDSIVTYKNGLKEGEMIIYFEQYIGKWEEYKFNYKNGVLDGKQYYYGSPAKIASINTYKNGELIKEDTNLSYDFDFDNIYLQVEDAANDTLYFNSYDSSYTKKLKIIGNKITNWETRPLKYESRELKDFEIVSFTQITIEPELRFHQEFSNFFTINLWNAFYTKNHELHFRDIKVKDKFGFIYSFNNFKINVILKDNAKTNNNNRSWPSR